MSILLVFLRFLFNLNIKIISRNTSTLSIRLKEFQKKKPLISYVIRPLVKFFYSRVDQVINQCAGMSEDLIKTIPKLDKKSTVIYNPISSQIINYSNKNDLTQIIKKNYILCVGRLEKVKAYHYAIESFAGIANNFPNLRLKIVGKGSLKHELKLKAIQCHVENKVDFEGFQKNIIPYFLYSKATILTSLYEGYPNILIESIAMNTPVVAFNCQNGPNEIIQDGINGYLAEYKSVEDLKTKLLMTLNNNFSYKNLKNSINKNQIENVEEHWEKLINQFNLNE